MIAAAFVLLLFSPLAFIYGRWRAKGLKARHGTLRARLAALLPMPLLFGICAAIAVIYENEAAERQQAALTGRTVESAVATGNGVIDLFLTLARWLGQIELMLFMVALPYLMGALVAAVLLILDSQGRITLPGPPSPADETQENEA